MPSSPTPFWIFWIHPWFLLEWTSWGGPISQLSTPPLVVCLFVTCCSCCCSFSFFFHFFFGEFFSVVFLLCDAVVFQNSSSFSMPQNQEKKQIPRYEVRFTNKNHPFMWLVCKTRAKILLSDPETSLTTPRPLPLRRSRRSYGNYQSPQSSGPSRNILKRLGRSGRSGRSSRLKLGKLRELRSSSFR